MTESEKQEIVSRVLSSLSTNSATIDQLIETGACTDNDYFETGKGNKVSYANMMKPIHQKYDRKFSDLNKDIVKKTTELNISVLYPTGGIGGSNKYDLATAIGKVPEELRVPGLVVSFLNQQSKVEKWTYQGGTWAAVSFIRQEAGGNKILEWNTDAATTRKQVPANERKAGMQISYKDADGDWVNEQYIGAAVSDAEWAKDTNWNIFLTELDYDKRGYSVFKEYIGLKAENGLSIGSDNSEYDVKYVDISNSDYVDAVVRSFEPTQPGITFWNANKARIITYSCNKGQYIDGNNFSFFLKRPDKAVYVSVGAYNASDEVNFLKLIKVPTGKDIINLDDRVSRNRNDIDKTAQELIPLKSATDLLTVVVADYTGLVDENGRNIDSTPAFAPEEITTLVPIRDCNIIQWCTKVFALESIAVILYSKNRKRIKQIKGTDGSNIEGNIYAGTIDLNSEEFKDNKPFYVAIGSYNASSDLNRLYLKLLKKLPKDAVSGIKNPLVNLMSAVRVVNNTDYFPNHWGNNAHKWWYNIGNALFIGNTKKEITKSIHAVARFSREDIYNLGMTGCSDLFLSIEGDKSRSSIAFSVSDGTTKVEHGYGKPYTNTAPYYGERAVRIDVSSLNLSDCDELILTVSIGFNSLGLSQLDIKLFKEMPYGDRPIVDSSYKSQYYGLPEYTFYGQEKLADAIDKVTDGGTLYIREGDYDIDNPISLKKSINIVGVGRVRLLGGKKISEAESQGTDDVYTKTVNTSDIGYAGASYIYQHDIPDSNTLIKDTERLHLYGDSQLYRLPSTRIWKSDSIDKVLSPQPDGKLYYYVDPESNLMTFRIAPGSSLSKNPVILNRIPYNTMGTLNKNDYNIACSWDDISIQNITNMYSAITVNGFNNLRMDNVKIFCVSTCPLRITTAKGLNNHFSNIEVAGGFEDGVDFGQPIPENFGIFIKCEKSKYIFENCWIHDNYGDGISEHGNDSVIIRDSVLEWNGLSGATPAGGESLYVNCIFRRNGWLSAERAGLYVLPADTDSHVVAIGCVSVDNWGADYGILSFGHSGSIISLQLYNCSSLQTDDDTSNAVALSASIKTEGKRHGYLGLFNFVTNRKIKFKGDKQNLTITQAPSVAE